ncbi:MAG: rhomboid family intramembrane serine protease [Treponema sp.]|nr:rhomboid family intramembrane serine protease [Treponema sp.]
MAKKKNKINFAYDSPVALSFAIITILLFVMNALVIKGRIDVFFYAPTNSGGAFPFNLKDGASYLRLVLYQFGYFDLSFLFADLIIILLLGQILEERYGSVIMGLMMFFSTLFSGVLNACFGKEKLCGAASIVIMMVFLNALTSISKKKVSVLSVATIVLVICREIFARNGGFISVIVSVAGGLCGSLFAFLASPKARAASKKEADGIGLKSKAELLEELDAASPRNNSKSNYKSDSKKSASDDETVVIGSIEL